MGNRAKWNFLINNMENEKTLDMRFQEHVEASDKSFDEIRRTLAEQPTKKELEKMMIGLATKKDVAGVVSIYDFVLRAAHGVARAGGWTYGASLGIIAFAAAFALVAGGFKAVLAWLFTWAMPK